ncbi:MAG TPA: DUF929 family protein, partial [Thermoplasmata archaeon]|nr:DUF929 family protein [Thermoplasmata archaeon]
AGCPSLSSNVTAEPGNWEKAANAAWTSQGQPKVFFYGSIACPYCSASSWAVAMALERFADKGVFGPIVYGYSKTGDTPSHVPETILAGTSLPGSYISWEVVESTDPNNIVEPALPGCTEQALVNTYDAARSIPFVVVGGIYFHVGSLVDPSPLQGLTTAEVAGQIANQSGGAWNAISVAAWTLEAFIESALLKAGLSVPPSAANDPNVARIFSQIH